MKKIISIILIIATLLCCFYVFTACNNNDWKNTNINGYYTTGIGWDKYEDSWAIELYKTTNNTKSFIIRYIENRYDNYGIPTEKNFYVAYGYYTIKEIYEGNETDLKGRPYDYKKYVLELEYIVRDEKIFPDDTITVTVNKDDVFCSITTEYNDLYKKS